MGSGPEPHGHPLVDLRDHLGQVVGCVNHEVGAALNSQDFNGSFFIDIMSTDLKTFSKLSKINAFSVF